MFSKKQREYLEDPDGFLKEHGENYVRKIRNAIRNKCVNIGEDLLALTLFYMNDDAARHLNGEKKKGVGRWEKPIVPLGFYINISAIAKFVEYRQSEEQKKKAIEYMKSNIEIMRYDILKDTQFGKWYYDDYLKQKRK